jgi:ferric iron reductase protein FhuF
MTTLERPTLDHPLNATLQKLQAGFTWTKLYTTPEGENWYSYQDIINNETGVFATLLEHYQKHAPYLSKRQAVQNVFSSLSWWCVAACYAPVLVDCRSPKNLEALHFHLHDEGYIDTMALRFAAFLCLPHDEAATHSKASVLFSREELVTKTLEHLQTALGPLIKVARQYTEIQEKALWLYVADNAAGLIMHMQKMLQKNTRCVAEVEVVLNQLPERGQTGVLEVSQQDYFTKRSTCCFYYLNPEGKNCATCPKLPIKERLANLQHTLAERV